MKVLTKQKRKKKEPSELSKRVKRLGVLKSNEYAEIARQVRLIDHNFKQLLMVVPPRMGIMRKVSVDLVASYAVFVGVRAQLANKAADKEQFFYPPTKKDFYLGTDPEKLRKTNAHTSRRAKRHGTSREESS